jgi:HlyD family secretion protein
VQGRRIKQYVAAALIAAGPIAATLTWLRYSREHANAPAPKGATIIAAAPGRIEGAAMTTNLGAATSGIVQEILINQGDHVAEGELLARLECNELIAAVKQRSAEQAAAAAVLERLKNGSRPDEIAAAEADVQLSEARLVEAEATKQRTERLYQLNSTSLAQNLTAERDARMSSAQVAMAEKRLALLRAGPREEEIVEAKARDTAAQHASDVAKAQLAKCDIRSPIDGVVLRKYASKGELVSIYDPKPIFSLAPVNRYRVRAEIDEYDIKRVHVGQTVSIVIVPPSAERLTGTVVEIGKMMGRRTILTTDPADKSDRDVLEIVVDIKDNVGELPIGLRVAVILQSD